MYFVPFRYPCRPVLTIQDSVDFGHVVANSKVISKEIDVSNHGSKAGDFKIKYTGDKPIAVIPSCGTVPPGATQKVKVRLFSLTQIFLKRIRIKVGRSE